MNRDQVNRLAIAVIDTIEETGSEIPESFIALAAEHIGLSFEQGRRAIDLLVGADVFSRSISRSTIGKGRLFMQTSRGLATFRGQS